MIVLRDHGSRSGMEYAMFQNWRRLSKCRSVYMVVHRWALDARYRVLHSLILLSLRFDEFFLTPHRKSLPLHLTWLVESVWFFEIHETTRSMPTTSGNSPLTVDALSWASFIELLKFRIHGCTERGWLEGEVLFPKEMDVKIKNEGDESKAPILDLSYNTLLPCSAYSSGI